MIGLGGFLALLALVLLLMGLSDQRRMWWRFQARRFRDPAANEPSDSAYRGQRILLLCVGAATAGASVYAFSSMMEFGPDHDDVLERVRSAADELENNNGQYKFPGAGENDGSWAEYINSDLRGPEADDPIAVLVSRSGDVERYRVAAPDGDVCIAMTARPRAGQPEPLSEDLDARVYILKTQVADRACE
ncbi:hypothetical protein OIE62_30835 [Streptomyces scopuliridis]|uniref:Uncharacterized protein n=1 Tax=Streptomyces scopuliridis TaxID=452529 RepID=A0ACD4ZGC9_9ACTN|nr:hypothetical protein [Streptomyces scopuliridis]WSB97330.1 hypothetical protein OG835_10100 [Streptomyces scopuliridis]WSC08967.1 hypothetical protein OIE62_30835 [Streptomyces scopuliridis]